MGHNAHGELSYEPSSWSDRFRDTPFEIGSGPIQGIAAGNAFALRLVALGTVLSHGDFEAGRLGNGATEDVHEPCRVIFPRFLKIVEIEAGRTRSIARDSTGAVWTWGDNDCGQLGPGQPVGTGEFSPTPVKVDLPD